MRSLDEIDGEMCRQVEQMFAIGDQIKTAEKDESQTEETFFLS